MNSGARCECGHRWPWVWWMERGALFTLHEGDCPEGVGEECECQCG